MQKMAADGVIACPSPASPETMDRWHRLEFLMAFMAVWHAHRTDTWNVTQYGPLFALHRECESVRALRDAYRRAGL